MTLWRQTAGAASDERSPLLPNQPSDTTPAALVDQIGCPEDSLNQGHLDGRLHGLRLVVTLLAVWGTNFTFALSTTAVSTLSPQIAGHFEHIELSSYIGSIFSYTSVLATPLFGALTGHLSRPASMTLAGSLFALGNIICFSALSMGPFLWGRAVAGVGGAGILCLSSLITTDLISLRERGYYQGLMMMLFAIGSALGGPITGVLAAHTSWRLTFLLPCLPILAISLVSLCLLLPRPAHHTADSHKHSLLGAMDLGGVSLLGLSVGTLLWALSVKAKAPTSATSSTSLVGAMTLGPAPGPNHEVAGWLLVSLAAFVGLIVLERSREKRKLRVLIPTDVVMQRNVFWTSLSAFLMCLANGAVVYNLPLYYTIVRSLTPTSTGLHMLPNSLMLGFGSLLSGQVIRSTGRYRVLGLVSLILPIGSALAMSRWAAGEIGTDTAGRGGWEEWFDAAPAGLGYSSFLVSSLLAILASVPREHIPKATALSYLFRTLGTTLGVALSSSFQQSVLVDELRRRFTGAGSASMINSIVHSKTYLFSLPPDLRQHAVESYAVSLRSTFKAMAVVSALALVTAWRIEEFGLGVAGERIGGGEVSAEITPIEEDEEEPEV